MAIDKLDGEMFAGKPVNVMLHKRRNERSVPMLAEVNTNVFVKNLPADTDDEGLRQMFQPFGEIVTAVV